MRTVPWGEPGGPVYGFGGHALAQQGGQVPLPLEAVVHAVDHDAVGVGGLLGDHGGQGGEFRLGDGTVAAGLCQRLLECPDLTGQEGRNMVRRLLGDLFGEGGFHGGTVVVLCVLLPGEGAGAFLRGGI